MLQTLRKQRKEWNPVERTAQEGDQVVIEYVAETEAGRVPPEGKQRLTVIMGESGFDGLESAIAEIPAGEEKNVELEFPETYREPRWPGTRPGWNYRLFQLPKAACRRLTKTSSKASASPMD